MNIPTREELVQAKNKTLVPFNGYNTDVALGVPSVSCNIFNFAAGQVEYRNDRMIQMVQVPVSRELFIQKIQIFSHRVNSLVVATATWAGNPVDGEELANNVKLYLCQNPVYSTSGTGNALATPFRVAISSGLIPSFELRFNDGFYTPEFEFPYWLNANETMYLYIDNNFPNPSTAYLPAFKLYTRITGVLATKSQERG